MVLGSTHVQANCQYRYNYSFTDVNLVCRVKQGSVCIVNAASDRDMAVFAAGMIQAKSCSTVAHLKFASSLTWTFVSLLRGLFVF